MEEEAGRRRSALGAERERERYNCQLRRKFAVERRGEGREKIFTNCGVDHLDRFS